MTYKVRLGFLGRPTRSIILILRRVIEFPECAEVEMVAETMLHKSLCCDSNFYLLIPKQTRLLYLRTWNFNLTLLTVDIFFNALNNSQ